MSAPTTVQNPEIEHVFLSYSRTDLDAAIAMRSALEQAGISTFRDEDSIRVSDNWMKRLQDTLQGCSAFVLLIGRDGVQRWVMAETQIALIRNFSPHDDSQRLPIFPVLLPGGDLHALPPFLNLFQIQRWSPQETVPDKLLDAIRAQADLLDQTITFEGCPFLGLSAFQPDDAALFFGRKRETLEALAFVGSQRDDSHPERLHKHNQFHHWLQVQGNSGSGKSSLVNAGLLPLIQQGALWARTGYPHWQIIGPLLPGEKPLEALAEALQHALLAEAERDLPGLLKLLRSDDDGLRLWLRERKQPDTA
ncbi:MAG: TIR domain-containing protein, partial [Thiolinea sp.]